MKTSPLLTGIALTAALCGCCATAPETTLFAHPENKEIPAMTTPTKTIPLAVGTVDVYDHGTVKLHAYNTGDALADWAFIVEGPDALVGIELPAFTASLEAWKQYVDSLGKPMNDIFLDAHLAGASYIKGMKVYGTAAAKTASETGSTHATTASLHKVFGDDFHGGDVANITETVSGPVTIGGIAFNVIDTGDTYDLAIPALNAVYTHMLGKFCHSILVSPRAIDAMLATLRGYQAAGYATILASHSGPEGQDAVAEKIAYLEKANALTGTCETADAFIAAMKEAFPAYAGENYLQMSAGFLFPAQP